MDGQAIQQERYYEGMLRMLKEADKVNKIGYKFNEGALIEEFKQYIDSTYGQHYAKDKFQATEFIMDSGHGEGFCIGNILKYSQRYGKKDGKNRNDLLKVIHYGIMALHNHDTTEKN